LHLAYLSRFAHDGNAQYGGTFLMAAIAFVGSNSAQNATTTVTVNKPGGPIATDILVAHWAVTGNPTDVSMALPTGWVKVAYFSPAGGPTVKLAYKALAATGEPTSYSFVLGTAAAQSVTLARYSNVDTSQLSDAYVAYTSNSGSGTALTALDIVPESDNAMLIACFANNLVTSAITLPTGFNAAWAQASSVRNTMAYALQATAGHSNDIATTQSASAGWTAILWAMRPVDLGTVITVTPGSVRPNASQLELTIDLVSNEILFGTTTFKANARANLPGQMARFNSFFGGFGERDPMYSWDGTGTVPTVNEVRGGVNVFNMNTAAQLWIDLANSLGTVPIDWIVWRLPWQFTRNPSTLVNSTQADYDTNAGSESRSLRPDKTTDFETYLSRYAEYVINRGARRFHTGSEWKGMRLNGTNWDFDVAYDFYVHCRNGILAGAAAAGVASNQIQIGAPYILLNWKGVANNSITTDSWNTVTTPIQTMRFKDAAVPPQWSLNGVPWGYFDPQGVRGITELLKLCVNNNTPVDFLDLDFTTWGEDGHIKRNDDFANSEEQTRDILRWARWTLQNVGDGRFANIPIDIAEFYIKPEGTIADTGQFMVDPANTSGPAIPIPGPFLPDNQLRPYCAAIRTIGLAVCVEEGARAPAWWNFDNEALGRTAPTLKTTTAPITTGNGNDHQAWYVESIVHNGAATDGDTSAGAEGSITPVGLVNKLINQHFGKNTVIRTVAVSDPSKVYALPNMTECVVVNKTAGRKRVSVNGQAVTLAPYDNQLVTYATSYTGTVAATLPSLTTAASGTTTLPNFSGAAAATLPSLTASAAGTRTVPAFSSVAAITLPSLTQAASGSFANAAYLGDASGITLGSLVVLAEGLFTNPTYSATAAVTLPSLTIVAVGIYGGVAYTGGANMSLPSLTMAVAGSFVQPTYTGTLDNFFPPLTVDALGNHVVPSIPGTIDITLSMIVVAALGRIADDSRTLYVEADVETNFVVLVEIEL
jgi:hypothetical protein